MLILYMLMKNHMEEKREDSESRTTSNENLKQWQKKCGSFNKYSAAAKRGMHELQAIFLKDGKWMKGDDAKENNRSYEIFQCSALSTGFSGGR